MPMYSNMLSENSANQSTGSLRNDAWPSYLYGVLAFNDAMHKIDIESACKTYRALKEDAINESNNIVLSKSEIEVYNEGKFSDFKEMISRAITAILEFIKKFIIMLTQKDIKVRRAYKECVRKSFKFKNEQKNSNSYTFTIHHGPSLLNVDENKVRATLNTITAGIDRICAGEFESIVSDTSLEAAFKTLAKVIRDRDSARDEYNKPVIDSKSFAEYVKTDIIYIERRRITYREWRELIKDVIPSEKNLIGSKLKNIKEDLEKCKNKVLNAEIVDEKSKQNADKYIAQIKAIISSYTWYLNALYDAETKKLQYIMSTYNKIKNNSISESGSIHGEPFNSDTLFDNEDLRDFNRTEWLDLNLTTENFQIKFELDEALRRIALQEAIIMSDDEPSKVMRMMAMREAEGEKTGGAISNIIATIKKIINEFFNKIKERCSENAKFLQRNTEFINRDMKIEKVSSSGDILAGLSRIQKNLTIIPFNYDSMKEDLKDKKTFFEKHILSSLKDASPFSKRDVKWSEDMSITDYCKAYFGASMPEDKFQTCVFTGKEIDQNKQNIVKFLNKPSVLQSINSDLNKLESEGKKVASATAKPVANKNNNIKNAEKSDTSSNADKSESKNESMYFSSLYGSWINEADIEMSNNSETTDNRNTEAENGNANNDQAAGFKVYMDAYKDVLMSKLTASEFIISEFMQCMSAHAKSYMNGEQKKAEAIASAK